MVNMYLPCEQSSLHIQCKHRVVLRHDTCYASPDAVSKEILAHIHHTQMDDLDYVPFKGYN